MTTQKVQAIFDVKSENFHQVFEETILDSSTTEQNSSYQELIAANERLKNQLSKVFTEFVNKSRLEQEANGDKKKRKNQHDEDENEDNDEEDGEDEDDDAESSDNNEEDQ